MEFLKSLLKFILFAPLMRSLAKDNVGYLRVIAHFELAILSEMAESRPKCCSTSLVRFNGRLAKLT